MIVSKVVQELEEILASEGPADRFQIVRDIYLLRASMKTVPTQEVAEAFEVLIAREQARIYATYRHLVEEAKSDEQIKFLEAAIMDEYKDSCEEFVDILTDGKRDWED